MRKFEPVKAEFAKYNNPNPTLPKRATKTAVCYDFYSPTDVILPAGKITLVWTNIKATFPDDEALIFASRSGLGSKGIMLANGIGITESDYYGNPTNDGNLAFALYNTTAEDYTINKGDRIGQGFFTKYLTVDNEEEITTERKGGFGSTGKN